MGFSRGRAQLHVAHFKEEKQCGEWDAARLKKHSNSFIFNNLAERVGFDSPHFG